VNIVIPKKPMPSFSVIIPTYNRSHLLKEAIESVLKQNYSDFEILVIDDGSTDNTRFVVEQISDKRVKYFYQNNSGQSSARNLGLIKSQGEYIAYLDEDDLWPVDYLATMVRELNTRQEYGAAYARVIVLYPDGKKRELGSAERIRSGWITKYFFEYSPCLMPSATCFRRSVCGDVFWDEAIIRNPDYDFFLRVSTKARFLFVPKTFVIKRAMTDSLSNLADPVAVLNIARTLERFYFHLGGDKYASLKAAKRKISHRYRKAAKLSLSLGDNNAALFLFKKAVSYYPEDVRLYLDMLKVLLKGRRKNRIQNWQMPESLPPYISVAHKS